MSVADTLFIESVAKSPLAFLASLVLVKKNRRQEKNYSK